MTITSRTDPFTIEQLARPSCDPADWRHAVPARHRPALRWWLWSIAVMTLLTLLIGGVTRLTRSGLSIVDWAPVMGVVPPLTAEAWQDAFVAYQSSPEYRELRQGMSLDEFKFIYFWEYLHRLVARAIGVVFLVPFIVFAVRRRFTPPLARRALVLFALGAGQGLMGWLMVMSGLVDEPHVSHYRLAAHLSLAFVIFGYAVWLARDLAVPAIRPIVPSRSRAMIGRGLTRVGVLLALQIVWGAFVAGLRAGYYYNTFPLMAGSLVPPDFVRVQPLLLNLLENPSAVQWVHRVLGTLLLLAATVLALRVRRAALDVRSRRLTATFVTLLAAQYGLGIATLVYYVPLTLGVLHQVMAMVLVGVWLVLLHHVRELEAIADHRAA